MRALHVGVGLLVAAVGGCRALDADANVETTTDAHAITSSTNGDAPPTPTTAITTTGAPPPSDDSSGLATTDTGDAPSLPSIGPTMGTLALDFRIAVSGNGSLLVGAIDLFDGVGTIVIEDRTLPVFVFERQPWPEQGYTLYQALAVEDDGWTMLWFYCGERGELASVYLESTHGIPLQSVYAEGTCDLSRSGVEVPIELPGTEFSVLYNGEPFTIEGPDIAVAAAELGEVTLQGVPYVVAPFETVDCSETCGTPGWYEVHVLLWDPEALRAGFSIVYFERDGSVRMTYGITLPDLSDPVGDTALPAIWSFG